VGQCIPEAALCRFAVGAGHLCDFVEGEIRFSAKEKRLPLRQRKRIDRTQDRGANRFCLRPGLRPGLYRAGSASSSVTFPSGSSCTPYRRHRSMLRRRATENK
jgi:hypothetical protein